MTGSDEDSRGGRRATDGEPDPPRARDRGPGRRRGPHRRGRPLDGAGARVRRDRARRDAARDQWLRDLPAAAQGRHLVARLRALARRGDTERPSVLEVGDLRLDPAGREVTRGEFEIRLSAKEFALLETFMRRPGEVLSRLHLLEHAWDFAYENRSNVVDVYVRHLRKKIDEPFGRRSLETVRGAGYRLRADGT